MGRSLSLFALLTPETTREGSRDSPNKWSVPRIDHQLHLGPLNCSSVLHDQQTRLVVFTALLVLLPASTRAGVITPDLRHRARIGSAAATSSERCFLAPNVRDRLEQTAVLALPAHAADAGSGLARRGCYGERGEAEPPSSAFSSGSVSKLRLGLFSACCVIARSRGASSARPPVVSSTRAGAACAAAAPWPASVGPARRGPLASAQGHCVGRGMLTGIQLRTPLQDNWANMAEILSRLGAPDLKYGGGPSFLRDFLLVSSEITALEERGLPVDTFLEERYRDLGRQADTFVDEAWTQMRSNIS